jgi:spermidine synthase/MFS family permease
MPAILRHPARACRIARRPATMALMTPSRSVAPPPPRLGRNAAATLTFLAAACVLILEIAAGRLLAPYVGVSLTTYTGIIGVILAGIALGAWAGGRAADAFGPERLIGPTIAAGGVASVASVPAVVLVGAAGLGNGPIAIVTLAAIGFVAPAAILSAVAPMIVRASLADLRTSGALVGRLSATGTAGAIAGTFLTGFVLLGLVPVRGLIVATGAVLVAIGLGAAWWLAGADRTGGRGGPRGTSVGDHAGGPDGPAGPADPDPRAADPMPARADGRVADPPLDRRRFAGLALGGLVLFGGAGLAAPDPCDRESRYYCITVVGAPVDGPIRTLILDDLTHTSVNLDDPTDLRFGYARRFADAVAEVLATLDRPPDALHVGGGGFSFPRYLSAVVPESRHTILELDPAVLETAIRELGYEPEPTTEIHLGDARLSMPGLATDAFDLALGDAFGGRAVPWHLTTVEFLTEVRRVLRPDGRYVVNLIDGPALAFVRAEAATLEVVFEHVAVVGRTATLDGSFGGLANVVLVASDAPISADAIRAAMAERDDLGQNRVIAGREAVAAFVGGASVLTDDHAPVDQLLGGR